MTLIAGFKFEPIKHDRYIPKEKVLLVVRRHRWGGYDIRTRIFLEGDWVCPTSSCLEPKNYYLMYCDMIKTIDTLMAKKDSEAQIQARTNMLAALARKRAEKRWFHRS